MVSQMIEILRVEEIIKTLIEEMEKVTIETTETLIQKAKKEIKDR